MSNKEKCFIITPVGWTIPINTPTCDEDYDAVVTASRRKYEGKWHRMANRN